MDLAQIAAAASSKPSRSTRGFTLDGIFIEFPFEPYDCQKEYMSKVLQALREGKNALLESPTGTGKTLCLLCACLAWRESLKGAIAPDQDPAAARTEPRAAAPLTSQPLPPRPSAPPPPPSDPDMPQSLINLLTSERSLAPSSASHPSSDPSVRGSGGGLGGGAGASTSNGTRPTLPTIIYSSRTHGQLAQVMKELRNTSYQDRVQSTVLASRQQTCIHPQVSKISNGAQANNACKSLVSKRKCSYHNQLKYGTKAKEREWAAQASVPDIEDLVAIGRNHSVCPFFMSKELCKDADIVFMPYNYLLDPNARKALVDQVKWEDAIIIFDEAHNVESVCSDASSFDITAKHLADAMVEARRCREACLEHLERGTSLLQGPHEGNYGVGDPSAGNVALNATGGAAMTPMAYRQLANDLEVLMRVLKLLENKIQSLVDGVGQEGMTRPGAYLLEILKEINIDDGTMPVVNGTIDLAVELVQSLDLDLGRGSVQMTSRGGGGGGGHASTSAIEHIQACLNLAFSTQDPIGTHPGAPPAHKGYRVHLHMEKVWGGDKLPAPTLSFWCFIPGMAFRMLRHLRLRSILLTSGTLAPLEGFAHELQMPFEIRLQNPHIISPSQVWVGVVPLGPSGHSLNSSYQSRDNVQYKEDLGNAVVNFARTIPDGLLVFFPSYSVMEMCISHWKGQGVGGSGAMGNGGGIWERIIRYKSPVIEPKDSSLFTAAIDEFKARLDDRSVGSVGGAVFFAVCRGKVSEGLDFSDRAGRGVIITGIPFAMKTDAKVKIKRQVLDEEMRAQGPGRIGQLQGSLSGEQWYVQQAMRAVNQAMGRVIRHRWDYGAIILADCRFEGEGLMKQTSRWLQEHVMKHPNFGQASASLTRFFKDKEGFQAPSDYGTRQGATTRGGAAGSGAFEFLGQGGGGSGGLPGRPRVHIADLAPSAVDLSGLLSIRGSGSGSGSGSGPSSSHPVPPSLVPPGGGNKRQPHPQGLMGMLKQQEASTAINNMPPPPPPPPPLPPTAFQSHPHTTMVVEPSSSSFTPHSSSFTPHSHSHSSSFNPHSHHRHNDSSTLHLPSSHNRPLSSTAAGTGGAGRGGGGGEGAAGDASRHKTSDPLLALLYKDRTITLDLGPHPPTSLTSSIPPPLLSASASASIASFPSSQQPTMMTKRPMVVRMASTAAPQPPPPSLHTSSAADEDRANPRPSSSQQHPDGAKPEALTSTAPKRLSPAEFMAKLKSDLPPSSFSDLSLILGRYKKDKDAQAFIEGATTLLKGPKTVHLLEGLADFVPKNERGWFSEVVKVHVEAAARALEQGEGLEKRHHQVQGRTAPAPPGSSSNGSLASNPRPIMSSNAAQVQQGTGLKQQGTGLKRSLTPVNQPGGGLAHQSTGAASTSFDNSLLAKKPKTMALGPVGEPCSICGKTPMEAPHQSPCKHSACYACWVRQVAQFLRCKQCGAQVRKNQLVKSFFQP